METLGGPPPTPSIVGRERLRSRPSFDEWSFSQCASCTPVAVAPSRLSAAWAAAAELVEAGGKASERKVVQTNESMRTKLSWWRTGMYLRAQRAAQRAAQI